MRCSPHISESSRSNSHDINHGRYSILLPWCLPGCQAFAPATYTPIIIPAAPTTSFTSPLETSPGCTWYITPSDNNKFSQSLPFSLQVQSPQATFTDQIFYFLLQIQIAKSCNSHFKSLHHYKQLLYDLRRLFSSLRPCKIPLNTSYSIVALINIRNKKMKCWSHPAFPTFE